MMSSLSSQSSVLSACSQNAFFSDYRDRLKYLWLHSDHDESLKFGKQRSSGTFNNHFIFIWSLDAYQSHFYF